MRKFISVLLAALSICLLLTACGHDMKSVCGEVVDILQDTAPAGLSVIFLLWTIPQSRAG